MWQVLVAAAAAAGSGILAKKFITPTAECEQYVETKSSPPQDSVFESDGNFKESSKTQGTRETLNDDATIFRFSCPEAASEKFRKNTRNGFKLLKKNGGSKKGKKKNGAGGGGRKEMAADQGGNGSGKRISIALKKRRTGKHAAEKCDPCVPKDNSFGWGVGVGVMYMLSAGTSEISRLNSAMDETVRTVKELKAEISRRKNLHNVNVPVAEDEAETSKKYVERSCNDPFLTRAVTEKKESIKAICPTLTDEGEYASSALTDNQKPEVLEMHQLEAELESELQKLPWCAIEGSSSEGRTDIFDVRVLAEGEALDDFENTNSCQYNGVSPAELDKKLCQLLVEQQESQITELQAELDHAHSKLQQKEAELQALKDCVKCLTEFSLLNTSDEETENHGETIADEIEEKPGGECTKSKIGMKRRN